MEQVQLIERGPSPDEWESEPLLRTVASCEAVLRGKAVAKYRDADFTTGAVAMLAASGPPGAALHRDASEIVADSKKHDTPAAARLWQLLTAPEFLVTTLEAITVRNNLSLATSNWDVENVTLLKVFDDAVKFVNRSDVLCAKAGVGLDFSIAHYVKIIVFDNAKGGGARLFR